MIKSHRKARCIIGGRALEGCPDPGALGLNPRVTKDELKLAIVVLKGGLSAQ